MDRRSFLKNNALFILAGPVIATWGTRAQIRQYKQAAKPLLTEGNLNRFLEQARVTGRLGQEASRARADLAGFLNANFSLSPSQKQLIASYTPEQRAQLIEVLSAAEAPGASLQMKLAPPAAQGQCVAQLDVSGPGGNNSVVLSGFQDGVGSAAFGQKVRGAVNPGTPCCEITAIDAATGAVTAKVNATGQSFEFKVADAALFDSLKVGQRIFANFKMKQVSVDGVKPCGVINGGVTQISKFGGVGNTGFGQNARGTVNPANPCCEITSINSATGIVTAKVSSTGQVFQFKMTNAQLFSSLKPGQAVFANFKTKQVSVSGFQPCCVITNLGGAAVRP